MDCSFKITIIFIGLVLIVNYHHPNRHWGKGDRWFPEQIIPPKQHESLAVVRLIRAPQDQRLHVSVEKLRYGEVLSNRCSTHIDICSLGYYLIWLSLERVTVWWSRYVIIYNNLFAYLVSDEKWKCLWLKYVSVFLLINIDLVKSEGKTSWCFCRYMVIGSFFVVQESLQFLLTFKMIFR